MLAASQACPRPGTPLIQTTRLCQLDCAKLARHIRGSETCDQKGTNLARAHGHWKRKVSTSDRPIALTLLDQNQVKIEHFRRPAHISDSMDYEVIRSGNTNSLPVFRLALTRHP